LATNSVRSACVTGAGSASRVSKRTGRNEELARLGRLAVGLIEFFEQIPARNAAHAFARQAPQAADGPDAKVGEQLERLRSEVEGPDRQRLQPAAVAARHPERGARRRRSATRASKPRRGRPARSRARNFQRPPK
jgi:hypothetical protein